ncbi:hypothetical protein IGI39_004790 [Enterococcus sp. AZ135]|uniref:universal stress protein n=1 Tax=unclassified Enterococcus TaxID=2608891 RepID=UPI003F288B7F
MLNKYNKVLVAIDGSEQSEKALKEAIDAAKRNEAFLTVITVSATNTFVADAHMVAHVLEQAEISSKTILKNAEEIISDAVVYEVKVLVGNPKAAIVEYAKEEKADLIIMGATGKGAFSRLLLGSTTAYVVNHAPCNVLVVR